MIDTPKGGTKKNNLTLEEDGLDGPTNNNKVPVLHNDQKPNGVKDNEIESIDLEDPQNLAKKQNPLDKKPLPNLSGNNKKNPEDENSWLPKPTNGKNKLPALGPISNGGSHNGSKNIKKNPLDNDEGLEEIDLSKAKSNPKAT